MLDIYSQFATNADSEVNGTVIPFGGAKFTVARSNNAKYSKMLTKLVEKNQIELDLGNDESNKLSDEIMVNVLANTILLGWEGVAYQGVPMEYSVENAKTLLAHKDFRREIVRMSDDIDHFRVEKEADQVKN